MFQVFQGTVGAGGQPLQSEGPQAGWSQACELGRTAPPLLAVHPARERLQEAPLGPPLPQPCLSSRQHQTHNSCVWGMPGRRGPRSLASLC